MEQFDFIIIGAQKGSTTSIYNNLIDHPKISLQSELNLNYSKYISLIKIEKINLGLYETIIIGASVRYGKHSSQLYDFIEKNTALHLIKCIMCELL